MTSYSISLRTTVRAAIVALTLGATALTAAPAFAQDAPSGFSLEIPGGNGVGAQTFGEGQMGTQRHGGWEDDEQYRCLTNREVRRGIAAYGFSRVEITRELSRDRVELRAVYRNWLYSMRVDKCTGEVTRVRPIRRLGNGIGLHFNFGN